MPDAVSLPQLLDLSLGTPELGAVNFNQLHKLLLEIINKLGLHDHTIKSDVPPGGGTSKSVPAKSSQAALAEKVAKVERDVNGSARDIIDKITTETPLTDLWQYMQVKKRVENNEIGLNTVSSSSISNISIHQIVTSYELLLCKLLMLMVFIQL